MLEQFYANLLGLADGWRVESVDQDTGAREVTVYITYDETVCRCPECGAAAKAHDIQRRTVRDLDTHQFKTILSIGFPRVRCPEHGVKPVIPPFAAANSRFTKAFENRIIQLCLGAPVQKVAADLGINWHVVAGIKAKAFGRGLARQRRRPKPKVRHLTVDETSFRKHHDYSTIVSDAESGKVLAVLPGREAEPLKRWIAGQQTADFSELRSVSMDMAPPYIKAVRESFPNADQIICYDRFHVAQLFTRAVDAARRKESAYFNRAGGENPLAKTRFEWLRNDGRTDNRTARRRRFHALLRGELKDSKTAKAWELKEAASRLWDYARENDAARAWKGLLWRLSHSRVGETRKLYHTVKEHLTGILNAIRLRASNAAAEARNGCIQRIKRMACGFRSKERFHREILYQFGGYELNY